MLELRIRACHVTGEFVAKDNRRRRLSALSRSPGRRASIMAASPIRRRPSSRSGSRSRSACRRRRPSSATASSTRSFAGEIDDIGIIVQGGLYNSAAARAGAARPRRQFRRDARADLCAQRGLSAGARGVDARSAPASARCWWSRKAIPNISSRRSTSILRRADIQTRGARQGPRCRRPANTPPRCCSTGSPRSSPRRGPPASTSTRSRRACATSSAIGAQAPQRRSASCRRGRRASAPAARSARCSAPSSWWSASSARPTSPPTSAATRSRTLPPFSIGNSVLGYGMALASAAAVGPNMAKRADRGHGRRRLLA